VRPDNAPNIAYSRNDAVTELRQEAGMSQLDDLLGGLLGGQSGGGGLDDILSQITGGRGGTTQSTGARAGGGGIAAALLPLIASFLQNGGLNKILSSLQQQGKGSQAQSWVGTGANEPVSGGDVEAAIGEERISEIADRLGISNEQAADAVAEVLPRVVDQVSPQGALPAESDLDDLFAQLAARSGN
jgi:uncharacterized protein YidB (DUF937 family)